MNRLLTGALIVLLCQWAWAKDSDAYTCVPNVEGSDWVCSPVPKPPRKGQRKNETTTAAPAVAEKSECRAQPEPGVMYSRSDDGKHWACRENAAGDTWACEAIAASDMPCDTGTSSSNP